MISIRQSPAIVIVISIFWFAKNLLCWIYTHRKIDPKRERNEPWNDGKRYLIKEWPLAAIFIDLIHLTERYFGRSCQFNFKAFVVGNEKSWGLIRRVAMELNEGSE